MWFIVTKLTLDIYMYTKFDDSSFRLSMDIIGAPKFIIDDRPRDYDHAPFRRDLSLMART